MRNRGSGFDLPLHEVRPRFHPVVQVPVCNLRSLLGREFASTLQEVRVATRNVVPDGQKSVAPFDVNRANDTRQSNGALNLAHERCPLSKGTWRNGVAPLHLTGDAGQLAYSSA